MSIYLVTIADDGRDDLAPATTLIASGVDLIEQERRYASAALIRQLLELEYLAWVFAYDREEAADWLRSSRQQRMARWQPRHLRERSGGVFDATDYQQHCELGGHPTPQGWHWRSTTVASLGRDNPSVPKYMFPLPEKPKFPVFGLGPQFDGFRWLIIWNDRQDLYMVSLGHGHPESGSWIAVSTYFKTPKRRVSEGLETGPTGVNDAVFDAVVRLGEIGHASDEEAKSALLESELAGFDPDAMPTLGAEWSLEFCVVDEQKLRCNTRHLGGAWATLVELPTVAISVTGPVSMAAAAWPITDVSTSLDRYE